MIVGAATQAKGDSGAGNGITIFPPNATPVSIQPSYSDWTAKWWQWNFTIPNSTNPTLDLTGANCGVGQSGPVFYLAGAPVTTPITRTCTVPPDRLLFFPLINAECSNVEAPPFFGMNEEQLRACAKSVIDGVSVSSLKLTIDGIPFTVGANFRFQSPLFTYTVPADNQQGVAGGTSPISISDGYWVFLQLSRGKHVLSFQADVTSGPGAGFSQDVTYNLTIPRAGTD